MPDRVLWVALIGLILGVGLALVARPVLGSLVEAAKHRRRRRELRASSEDWVPEADVRPDHDTWYERQQSRIARRRAALVDSATDAARFYVAAVDVTSIRSFSRARFSLRFPDEGLDVELPNVTVILGDNGSGKSTALKSIALSALAPILGSSGFVPYHLVSDRRPFGSVRGLFVSDSEQGNLRILEGAAEIVRRTDLEVVESLREQGWDAIYDESGSDFLVVGYGANRRVSDDPDRDPSLERGRRRRRYQRVASLFEEQATLVPLGSWLPNAGGDRQDEIRGLIDKLLPPDARMTEDFLGTEIVIAHRGTPVPFHALSDGFRAYIGWIGDLLFQLSSIAPGDTRLRDIGGIVLIDEVDLYLHPSWQRTVVPDIARIFPKIQFVLTTHSPIVAGTVQAANLLLASQAEDGTSTLTNIGHEIHGLSAEQVLLSSYFGLDSTRAAGRERELIELANRALDGDHEAAGQYLRALTEPVRSDEPDR